MKPKSVRSCSKGRKIRYVKGYAWKGFNEKIMASCNWKKISGWKVPVFILPASIAKKMIKKLGGYI